MKCFNRIFPLASLAVAAVVTTLTTAVVVQATQTITTPNAAFFTYSLAKGANSAAITPVKGQSVLVMGTETAPTIRGLGQVAMLHINVPGTFGPFLMWTGLDSPTTATGGSGVTSGFGSTAGTHIVFIDSIHAVDLRVNTGDTFVVHNGSSQSVTGNVTLMW